MTFFANFDRRSASSVEMILALGDDHRRAAGFERRQDVIKDQIVPRRVLSKLCIKFLDCRLFIWIVSRKPKFGAPENDLMVEGPSRRLLPGIDPMTDRAALHEDDRVVAVLSRHRRRQAEHVSGLGLPRDGFEAHGGEVMAFIDDDMAVVRDQIGDDALPNQALHEGDIDDCRSASSSRHG